MNECPLVSYRLYDGMLNILDLHKSYEIKKVSICGFTTDKATKEEFIKNEISLKVADQRKFLAKSVVCLNSFSDNSKTFQHKECFVGSAVFQFRVGLVLIFRYSEEASKT